MIALLLPFSDFTYSVATSDDSLSKPSSSSSSSWTNKQNLSSATNSSSSSGDHVLFDLHALFSSVCRSMRISTVRKQLIGQCFENAHGGLEDDLQWQTTPAVILAAASSSFSAGNLNSQSSSSSSASSVSLASLQDPWLMLEGLSSSPLIDFLYEHSKLMPAQQHHQPKTSQTPPSSSSQSKFLVPPPPY